MCDKRGRLVQETVFLLFPVSICGNVQAEVFVGLLWWYIWDNVGLPIPVCECQWLYCALLGGFCLLIAGVTLAQLLVLVVACISFRVAEHERLCACVDGLCFDFCFPGVNGNR